MPLCQQHRVGCVKDSVVGAVDGSAKIAYVQIDLRGVEGLFGQGYELPDSGDLSAYPFAPGEELFSIFIVPCARRICKPVRGSEDNPTDALGQYLPARID